MPRRIVEIYKSLYTYIHTFTTQYREMKKKIYDYDDQLYIVEIYREVEKSIGD